MKAPIIETTISQLSSEYHDFPLDLIRNQFPDLSMEIKHEIALPILCSASQNPKAGSTIEISYQASSVILELFSLEKYINAFINHPEVRDLEYLTQVIAIECQRALNVSVVVTANIILNGLQQSQQIKVSL